MEHKKDYCLCFDTNSKQTKLKLVLNFMQLQYRLWLCRFNFTAQMAEATRLSLYSNHGYILFTSVLRILLKIVFSEGPTPLDSPQYNAIQFDKNYTRFLYFVNTFNMWRNE